VKEGDTDHAQVWVKKVTLWLGHGCPYCAMLPERSLCNSHILVFETP